MKKNFLAFIAISTVSIMLFACGSQDGSPAELKNNWQTISPFDTLVVEFNSNIVEIDKLTEGSNIILSDNVDWVQQTETSSSKFKFVGKNATPKGSPYFNTDKTDSIVFQNLKNTDSYIKERAVFKFSTLQIIGDIDYSNYNESSAKDLNPFFTSTKKTIEFAGILDHRIAGNEYNFHDYYKLDLRMNDTIKIVVNATYMDILGIQLTEPGRESVDKTFTIINKVNEFEYIVGSGHLNVDAGEASNKEVPFYIKIFDDASPNDPSNPYTLSISRLR